MENAILIISLSFLFINIFTLIILWTKSIFTKSQKWRNTLFCFLFPFAWNIIVLLIIRADHKKMKIMTKDKRKINTGTSGDALTN